MDSLKTVTPRRTPQNRPARAEQVKNSAGGYTFEVSQLERAKRFLILGSEASFYKSGAELSRENADNLIKIIEGGHSAELVDLIVDVSTNGRAAKQNAGVFALAVASSFGTNAERRYALEQLNRVARTATTLFMFIGYAKQFRGFGPALRRAVAGWYADKSTAQIAYQAVKYREREGYTHRDALRLSHPTFGRNDELAFALREWMVGRTPERDTLPRLVQAFEEAKEADEAKLVELIRAYNLTHEMVPTDGRTTAVWRALAERMPLGALVRQLPTLTRNGVFEGREGQYPLTAALQRLSDPDELKNARIHPLNLLIAQKTYASGRSQRGSSSWTPVRQIVDALDRAFYASFGAVTPSGKRHLIGLDVSGSMSFSGNVAGVEGITAREATAAFSLVLAATEPWVETIGFTGGGRGYTRLYGANDATSAVTPLTISPRQRLDDVVRTISNLPFGTTDCALPMQYAIEKGLDVDTFLIMTDNETWAGGEHPHQALERYRKTSGNRDAKLIVFSTQATSFSIADPSDAGMLDIPGFDSAVPQIITEFSRGL